MNSISFYYFLFHLINLINFYFIKSYSIKSYMISFWGCIDRSCIQNKLLSLLICISLTLIRFIYISLTLIRLIYIALTLIRFIHISLTLIRLTYISIRSYLISFRGWGKPISGPRSCKSNYREQGFKGETFRKFNANCPPAICSLANRHEKCCSIESNSTHF